MSKKLWGIVLLALLAVGVATCGSAPAPNYPRFAVRVIDEGTDGRSAQGPPGDDRIPFSTRGIGKPGFLWLKREGGFGGPLISEAHVAMGADGQPVVALTMTPEGADKLKVFTSANLGRRMAVVVNGKIETTGLLNGPLGPIQFQISGYYTEAEARDLATDLTATSK
jgi:preprotein translocase subunit SecD